MSRHKDHCNDKELKMIFTFFVAKKKILFKKILSSSSEIKKTKKLFFFDEQGFPPSCLGRKIPRSVKCWPDAAELKSVLKRTFGQKKDFVMYVFGFVAKPEGLN